MSRGNILVQDPRFFCVAESISAVHDLTFCVHEQEHRPEFLGIKLVDYQLEVAKVFLVLQVDQNENVIFLISLLQVTAS